MVGVRILASHVTERIVSRGLAENIGLGLLYKVDHRLSILRNVLMRIIVFVSHNRKPGEYFHELSHCYDTSIELLKGESTRLKTALLL